MAANALIRIDGGTGSKMDTTINAACALSNTSNTGVVSWLWELVDQPVGAVDSIGTPTASTASLTPRKEGTYLLRLTVNKDEPDEHVNQVVLVVRQLKVAARVPAAVETTEAGARGWATSMGQWLGLVERASSDPFFVVGEALSNLTAGDVVYCAGVSTIKLGLPGEERVPAFAKAKATNATDVRGGLAVVIGTIDGGSSVSAGKLFIARTGGLYRGLAGSPAVGDYVYVSDTALLALAPGTNSRTIGTVCRSGGGTFDVYLVTTPLVAGGGPAPSPSLPDGNEWATMLFDSWTIAGGLPGVFASDVTAGYHFVMREAREVVGATFYWSDPAVTVVRVSIYNGAGPALTFFDVTVNGAGMYAGTFPAGTTLLPGVTYVVSTYDRNGLAYTPGTTTVANYRNAPEVLKYHQRLTGYAFVAGEAQPSTLGPIGQAMILAPYF